MNISLLEPIGVSKHIIDELAGDLIAQGHRFTYYDTKTVDAGELAKRSQDQDIVIIANNPYPAEVIHTAERLKMIDVSFTGIDHVDTTTCKSRGITVCNAANYSNETVAELVIGLTIAVLRKIPTGDIATRVGKTSLGLTGREIAGRTVGIIGTGRIGTVTARLFAAFGARVIAYSRTKSAEAERLGVTYVTLEELMKESDIISLHVPSTAETKHLINAERISLMKTDAILINCARGAIVDNAALAEALRLGKIAGAGIDVFDMEPPLPEKYPLLDAPNTILTPHIAFASEESMKRRAEIVFENIRAYLNGTPQNICKLCSSDQKPQKSLKSSIS
ncbi:2-hydroxyacid dehydrogenase [Methanorbis rubei]|uniref:Glycerate dehydrogenase n=1 Tax=Methanorbis rubei TaxID=3028300 RepID=A0AAE4MES6_9EURY|nr:Glycerate dehydrogenase [Methanocorpusculaceae archaeon Cs1]